jgi:hypothetical protein
LIGFPGEDWLRRTLCSVFFSAIANGNVDIASRTIRAQRDCRAESAPDTVHIHSAASIRMDSVGAAFT